MSVTVIGIDGLDFDLLSRHMDRLPGFKMLQEKGALHPIATVFPADSVPAWLSIFTGLTPGEHGIIRGKDYVESVEDYEKKHTFKLEGHTFWDELSRRGKSCLVLNPFLAYPAWPIRGEMISGPAFVDGPVTLTPDTARTDAAHVYGGYSAVGTLAELKQDMRSAYNDTVTLWEEFQRKRNQVRYDMSFVTFTTLDRIQHYAWRFSDPNDPLHEQDDYLSGIIPQTLSYFDQCIQDIVAALDQDDSLVVISDHGFRQRPFDLINFNEILRQAGLLLLNQDAQRPSVRIMQTLKRRTIQLLSALHLLDRLLPKLKHIKGVSKYKKSDYLIDRDNSVCFVDALFSGKKPYVGLNFGAKIKRLPPEERQAHFDQVVNAIRSHPDIPQPLWIRSGAELYAGAFSERLPDICLELPAQYGVEFDLFAPTLTHSATHYRLSGGHYGQSTFGFYSPSGTAGPIDSVLQTRSFILSLFKMS